MRQNETAPHRAPGFLIFLAILAACGDWYEPPPRPPARTLALVRYGGEPVPAALGALTDRQGRPTGCRGVVSDGLLALHPGRDRFSFHVNTRNSCTGAAFYVPSYVGPYEEGDDWIVFDPEFEPWFGGQVRGDTVVLPEGWTPRRLTFVKTELASAPITGRFRLARTESGPVPSGLPPQALPECLPEVRSGFVEFQPESGTGIALRGEFDLEYWLAEPCTGHDWGVRMHGPYEQIAGLILMLPERWGVELRATLSGEELVMQRIGETDLVFVP